MSTPSPSDSWASPFGTTPWTGPLAVERLPSSRRRLGLAATVALALVLALAFGATVATQRVTEAERRALVPAATPTARPSASPGALGEVATAALTRVVTVEALTSGSISYGTGWLFDGRGDFITNSHVIQGQRAVRLIDRGGVVHTATVIGSDRQQDVAVVRSDDGFSGTPLPLAADPSPRVPAPVVVLASSRATAHEDVTTETLVSVHESVTVGAETDTGAPGGPQTYSDMLVLRDHQIYQGNSGGPVVDTAGAVLGIVTVANLHQPVGYAIPVSRVAVELQALAAH